MGGLSREGRRNLQLLQNMRIRNAMWDEHDRSMAGRIARTAATDTDQYALPGMFAAETAGNPEPVTPYQKQVAGLQMGRLAEGGLLGGKFTKQQLRDLSLADALSRGTLAEANQGYERIDSQAPTGLTQEGIWSAILMSQLENGVPLSAAIQAANQGRDAFPGASKAGTQATAVPGQREVPFGEAASTLEYYLSNPGVSQLGIGRESTIGDIADAVADRVEKTRKRGMTPVDPVTEQAVRGVIDSQSSLDTEFSDRTPILEKVESLIPFGMKNRSERRDAALRAATGRGSYADIPDADSGWGRDAILSYLGFLAMPGAGAFLAPAVDRASSSVLDSIAGPPRQSSGNAAAPVPPLRGALVPPPEQQPASQPGGGLQLNRQRFMQPNYRRP